MTPLTIQSRRMEISADFGAIQGYFEQLGWTDELSVVPATEDLVRKMLCPTSRTHPPAWALCSPGMPR